MTGRTPWPIYIAIGTVIGVIGAYLIAGGASYRPLQVADPCEPRSIAVLAERGVLEGIVLSGLDGAACELQVTREELLAALADDEALAEFADRYGVEPDEVDDAIRAGLVRAVDDAEREGLISGLPAVLARAIAANAPIGTALDLFRAIPGTPTLPQMLQALADAGVTLDEIDQLLGERAEDLRLLLEELLEGFGGGIRDLRGLVPEGLPEIDLERLDGAR
jgi:hypothetical protein